MDHDFGNLLRYIAFNRSIRNPAVAIDRDLSRQAQSLEHLSCGGVLSAMHGL
jgi:hypothetical protein